MPYGIFNGVRVNGIERFLRVGEGNEKKHLHDQTTLYSLYTMHLYTSQASARSGKILVVVSLWFNYKSTGGLPSAKKKEREQKYKSTFVHRMDKGTRNHVGKSF